MPALQLPRKSTVLFAAGILVTLFLAWLIAAFHLFYNVDTTAPKQADAVVMLGGASKERLLDAMILRADLKAPYLVISNTRTPGNASADDYCETHSNKVIYPDVICFTPEPMDTRGEAASLGQLAAEYHWDSVSIVTSKYHLARAGHLMDQCVNSEVTMVPSEPQLSIWQWLQRFIIETGGLIDVNLRPQCR